jgi:hypothetical protein
MALGGKEKEQKSGRLQSKASGFYEQTSAIRLGFQGLQIPEPVILSAAKNPREFRQPMKPTKPHLDSSLRSE